jgi:hypothetical protein
MRMEIVIAIELILGAAFVVVFWCKNPDLVLSRRSSEQPLDPHGDEAALLFATELKSCRVLNIAREKASRPALRLACKLEDIVIRNAGYFITILMGRWRHLFIHRQLSPFRGKDNSGRGWETEGHRMSVRWSRLHIRMQDYLSSLRFKVALVAITILMSSCWTTPNANLRPKGEPRVIDDSIQVEISMPPMRVESIDLAKRILVASLREGPTIEMKIAPVVRNLEDVRPGDQIRPKVRENLTVSVALREERGDSGVTASPSASHVLVIDPSYRLLKVQYSDGRTDIFKVGLNTRLKDVEPGDSVVVNTLEAVDLRIRHQSSRH